MASVERQLYQWFQNIDNRIPLDTDVHFLGQWFWCPLVDGQPRHPLGTQRAAEQLKMRKLRPAVHACSLYTLQRSVMRGLQPGPLLGRGGERGIFCFETEGKARAIALAQYAVYSDMGHNLLISPRLLLAVDTRQAGTAEVGI